MAADAAGFTLVDDGRVVETSALAGPDGIRLSPAAVRTSLGWELKPQGLCRGDTCMPVPPEHRLLHPDGIDLAALASVLERPLAIDLDERVAWLGASAAERGARLQSLEAPDFTLPDLQGRDHSLSDYRGRRILLLAWASW
jgi:hypothetical protein